MIGNGRRIFATTSTSSRGLCHESNSSQRLLQDIASKCFIDQPFKLPQANRVANWVSQQFSERPEHPFKQSPDIAVLRETSSSKWYGLVMNIPKNKLKGTVKQQSSNYVEVLEVKINPADRPNLLKLPRIYHGYHVFYLYMVLLMVRIIHCMKLD